MNKSHNNVPIRIELTDIITPKSCSFLVAELIKYIAYNKQQIPFPYERLKLFVLKRRERLKLIEMSGSKQEVGPSIRASFLMEKYYKKIEEAFEILDNTFKCIEHELTQSKEYPVEEVVLLFGATPISPKDMYRIHIPPLSFGHAEGQHIWKRQIGNLFRGIIVSDEVNANMQRKVGLTNMFVMIKIKEGRTANSKWLLPKDHYRLSERTQQVCFSFKSSTSKTCTCSFEVNQYETLSKSMAALNVSDTSCETLCIDSSMPSELDYESVWFQTIKSLKGFRDCKSHGKSVTDLWYKYSYIL